MWGYFGVWGGERGERGECSDVISIEVILSDAWKVVTYLLGKVVTATNGGLDSVGCSQILKRMSFPPRIIPAYGGAQRWGPRVRVDAFFFVCLCPERSALAASRLVATARACVWP